MEVVLLGTGSADGWPNPFCACASCAALRARGEVRGQTSVLVDGTLLLDCGPEAPAAASRARRDLTRVRHLLLTHGHPDHAAPAALLWRSWAIRSDRPEPLVVTGPPDALAPYADWIGPDDPVTLRPVRGGDAFDADGWAVRVVDLAHEVPAVAYDVSGPDGDRLLYATDTGPLPTGTVRALAGRAYGLVLLEETFGERTGHGTGHLDLDTFAAALADLRAVGAVTPTTDVVAVHLSHHNPPDVGARLAAVGARVVPDGTAVRVGGPAGSVLVLGGARSGKSTYAEGLLAGVDDVVYVATGGSRPDDEEWAVRVAQHRARRPLAWTTAETTDLEPLLRSPGPPLLVDCLALWLTAVLDELGAWDPARWSAVGRDALERRVDGLVAALAASPRRVVLVSNEVGSGVVPSHASGRLFRDELGRLNARVGAVVDEAVLLVAGRALPLPAPAGAGVRTSAVAVTADGGLSS